MVDLTDLSAASTFAGFEVAQMRLTEAPTRVIWSIAPFPGREAALEDLLDAGFPAPNRCVGKEGARLIWSGRAQALWLGATAPAQGLAQQAALVDQSDAWYVLRLEGDRVEDVLARLCPLDLAPALFKPGHTARSLVGHMSAQITRLRTGFEVMVYRSMAQTAVHEVIQAMRSVAARRALSMSGASVVP